MPGHTNENSNIMILRRVIKHFREQEWTAIFLDFIIVVVGVFVGLQVNNWSGQQAENRLEQQYLERLYVDMNGSLQDYGRNNGWDERTIASQAIVLKALRSGTLDESEREAFALGLVFVGSLNPIRRRWGTVEELKSTGNIAILRDLEIRNMIAAIDADYERSSNIIAVAASQVTQIRTVLMQAFSPLEYGFQMNDPIGVNYDFEALAADQRFINLFANVQFKSELMLDFNDGHMRQIEQLRDKLAEILEIEVATQ
ncbi:MAG: hypothetical protein COA84_12625 [Robiginitomaculum sp.]|nr:MAG: hypothetical protein COA84_12625 [Robiginitomaculum sp.]